MVKRGLARFAPSAVRNGGAKHAIDGPSDRLGDDGYDITEACNRWRCRRHRDNRLRFDCGTTTAKPDPAWRRKRADGAWIGNVGRAGSGASKAKLTADVLDWNRRGHGQGVPWQRGATHSSAGGSPAQVTFTQMRVVYPLVAGTPIAYSGVVGHVVSSEGS